MKKLSNIFYALLVCLFCAGTSAAQTTKLQKKAEKVAEIKRIVDGRNFIFKANFAMPLSASSIPAGSLSMGSNSAAISLSSNYDLTLSHDTLAAFLPYYGVAYSAPLDSREGGIKFTTTKFDYDVKEKKNGNIEVLFKPIGLNPRVPSDAQKLMLIVSPGGYADLRVILLNRQSISFTGTIEEIKPKKAS